MRSKHNKAPAAQMAAVGALLVQGKTLRVNAASADLEETGLGDSPFGAASAASIYMPMASVRFSTASLTLLAAL